LRVHPTLQARLQREDTQTHAQSSHTTEERWCIVDQYLHETVSSTCAVVGFFVGYTVALPTHIRAFPTVAIGVVRGLEYLAARALWNRRIGNAKATTTKALHKRL
jgi:hypothetical protein